MGKSTIVELPNEIEALIPESERTKIINQIITESRQGEFHDFKNDKYACCKAVLCALIDESKEPRLFKIRDAVKSGYYDESPDDVDKAAMKKDWLENGGTEEVYNIMFGGKL